MYFVAMGSLEGSVGSRVNQPTSLAIAFYSGIVPSDLRICQGLLKEQVYRKVQGSLMSTQVSHWH
jgi:hypothetical protein